MHTTAAATATAAGSPLQEINLLVHHVILITRWNGQIINRQFDTNVAVEL